MIIYFTGTGNSRFLAEIIAAQLNDEIADAAEHIQHKQYPAFDSDKPYVFVAPTYAWRLPHLFEEWIRKSRFLNHKKAYFILNCGSDIGAAGIYAEKLCREIGFTYMGMAEVVMPENYIAMFSAPSKEESQKIIRKAIVQTQELAADIAAETPFKHVKITPVGQICSRIVNPLFYKYTIKADKFYVRDTCISCGQCADRCMLNNISMDDGKPVWGKNCTHCMACICGCPTEAIEYGKHTVGLRRYMLEKEIGEMK